MIGATIVQCMNLPINVTYYPSLIKSTTQVYFKFYEYGAIDESTNF